MKIIFFGNTKYSLIGLKILNEQLGISCVVTIPNSPTESYAHENSMDVILAQKITGEIVEDIKKLNPDLFIVEDYGLILPQELLDIPKYGSLNIHHSLLPKYRGPAPVPYAILSGDEETGVTVIKMQNDVDAGNILAQAKCKIAPQDTSDSILKLLNEMGAKLMVKVIQKAGINPLFEGKLQDPNQVTFTHKMKKEDGLIHIQNPPEKDQLLRKIRAFYPWPGVHLTVSLGGKPKILKLMPYDTVQVEGKNPMTYHDFINGYGEDATKILKELNLQ